MPVFNIWFLGSLQLRLVSFQNQLYFILDVFVWCLGTSNYYNSKLYKGFFFFFFFSLGHLEAVSLFCEFLDFCFVSFDYFIFLGGSYISVLFICCTVRSLKFNHFPSASIKIPLPVLISINLDVLWHSLTQVLYFSLNSIKLLLYGFTYFVLQKVSNKHRNRDNDKMNIHVPITQLGIWSPQIDTDFKIRGDIQLIHFVVQQKLAQHCKATVLQ